MPLARVTCFTGIMMRDQRVKAAALKPVARPSTKHCKRSARELDVRRVPTACAGDRPEAGAERRSACHGLVRPGRRGGHPSGRVQEASARWGSSPRVPGGGRRRTGDLLWYIANIASKCDLSLADLAAKNLSKTRARWLPPPKPAPLFDDGCPASEQLPRHFRYAFAYLEANGKRRVVMVGEAGELLGDPLTDNAYAQDGYRFHDVLHLAHAAVLGWSPVLRRLLGRKRRSSEALDEVEDGGRAQVLEETVAAATYEYAARHNFLQVARVDWDFYASSSGLRPTSRSECAPRPNGSAQSS